MGSIGYHLNSHSAQASHATNGNGVNGSGKSSQYGTIFARLSALQKEADDIHALLQSQDVSAELHSSLHDPDHLPDRQLTDLSAGVVDSLERVTQDMAPSVSILTESFFGMYSGRSCTCLPSSLTVPAAFLQTKALWTVVEAKIPDLLHQHGPQTAKKLGLRAGIQPERLAQLLDTLINIGIFTTSADGSSFQNNRVSDLLRRDHWTQWHLWSDLYGNDFFDVSRSMPEAVKIGEARSAAQLSYGTDMDLFDYLAEKGLMEKFHKTLGAGAIAQAKGLAVDYPFEEIAKECFIDIGGGSGAFLASVLRTHPEMRGSLFDLSHVVENVTPAFRNKDGQFADIGARVPELLTGNFLESVPPSSVYTMKWCLHDWMDEDVVTVFKNVRRSMVESPASRFLVFESVKRPGRSSQLPRYGDLIMMITVNGKERSVDDWHRLAAEGGWRIASINPIRRAWPCAIDLRPI